MPRDGLSRFDEFVDRCVLQRNRYHEPAVYAKRMARVKPSLSVLLASLALYFDRTMKASQESVCLRSLGDTLAGVLFLPAADAPSPAIIICHGAGEFKENYFELCEFLAARGLATLAIDMHGHGQSGGERYHVNLRQWVADICAATDFLETRSRIDGNRIGAFGLSSGGTAVLEAALVEPRLKTLVTLDATVRDSLPLPLGCFLKLLVLLGKFKRRLTGYDLRVPLARLPGSCKVAADPEVERKLQADPRLREAYMAFPFPGAAEAFFVDTLRRVSNISAPTLILWGAEDRIDPIETARLLYDALTCKKQLHIIPGNGHLGHLDRHKDKVFALTADWILQNLAKSPAAECAVGGSDHGIQNHQCGCGQETWAAREMGAAFAVP